MVVKVKIYGQSHIYPELCLYLLVVDQVLSSEAAQTTLFDISRRPYVTAIILPMSFCEHR